jgi:hypothetical protein
MNEGPYAVIRSKRFSKELVNGGEEAVLDGWYMSRCDALAVAKVWAKEFRDQDVAVVVGDLIGRKAIKEAPL